MTTAIFGLLGVAVGAVLNFLLHRAQERSRWHREDQLKFEPDRLALYRDLLNELERTRALERFDRDKLWRLLSEIELLGSREVFQRAWAAFECAEDFWETSQSDEWPKTAVTSDGAEVPFDLHDFREHFESLLYRFIRVVRKELGVPTDFRPTKVTIKGKIVRVPEDVRELREMEETEARPRWRRVLGR